MNIRRFRRGAYSESIRLFIINLSRAMMRAYGSNGQILKTMQLYDEMVKLKIEQNQVTYIVVLNSMAHGGGNVEQARQIYKTIDKKLLKKHPHITSTMVLENFYAQWPSFS